MTSYNTKYMSLGNGLCNIVTLVASSPADRRRVARLTDIAAGRLFEKQPMSFYARTLPPTGEGAGSGAAGGAHPTVRAGASRRAGILIAFREQPPLCAMSMPVCYEYAWQGARRRQAEGSACGSHATPRHKGGQVLGHIGTSVWIGCKKLVGWDRESR